MSFPGPPPTWPVDHELVAAATEALQTHEKLNHKMKSKLKDSERALSSGNSSLSELRTIKSQLEGSHFTFKPLSLEDDRTLSQLKHLVRSHTPSTLDEATKASIAENLANIFSGQVKKLVYACVLTCPWFAQAQIEISAQSHNNILYVVFVATDEQFFSLATPHERSLCETVDEGGFLFATEVRHFCSQLQQGNVRAVEAVCAPPECCILKSQEWVTVSSCLDPVSLLQKSFVEECIGQAVRGLVKKKKGKGHQVLQDDASLTKFCDAFRLLSYVEQAQRREAISPWPGKLEGGSLTSNSARQTEIILKLLSQGFEKGIVQRDQLLRCVLEWRDRLEGGEGRRDVPECGPDWSREMGQWLMNIRLDGLQLSTTSAAISAADQDMLTGFLLSMGITSVNPEDVLVVAKSGSHMYGLATPTSDTDYIIVFREPTESMLSSYVPSKEALDNRGQKMSEEMAAYEVRKFSEMLLKGAVNIVEMVFSEPGSMLYASEYWKALTAHRELFMAEEVILQYVGYVKNHMKIIKKGRHAGTPREGKIFYHIYHKLLSLERFITGHPPVVLCSESEREHIMKIRTGPLEGELEPSVLMSVAERRLESVQDQLLNWKIRLREFGDYRMLQTWLLHVRGVGLTMPLRLATPPPTGTRLQSHLTKLHTLSIADNTL